MLQGRVGFIHGGPGGHALIEKSQLENFDNIYFWQEPTPCASFQASVDDLKEFILKNHINILCAHSFGCLTAAHTLIDQKVASQIDHFIMLAPTFDIVACDLAIIQELMKNNEKLRPIYQTIKEEQKVWSPNVLQALQLVNSDPNYLKLYWDSMDNFNKFVETFYCLKPPIDINNYIAIRSTYQNTLQTINTQTTAVCFERDQVARAYDQMPIVKQIFTNISIKSVNLKHMGHIEHNFTNLYKIFQN